ncbi:MAG TPA: hypothetical protein DCM87_13690 [Planctomycetes bacterium]|nr:hypothetical protein [Planctomycetota bacterium]
MPLFRILLAVIAAAVPCLAAAPGDDLPRQAADALRAAVTFFSTRVACEGGYLWCYSEDLSRREGEGKANATTVWVQPPGTPSVGMALLDAHEATGDAFYRDAARTAGDCLRRGQLCSGGWTYSIAFDPAERTRFRYRVDPPAPGKKPRNTTTLDDDTTQSALRFLMRLDKTLGFADADIHGAVEFALAALLAAQFPNGAWPQGFEEPPDPAAFPVVKASYPSDWSRTPAGGQYWKHYTLNDNVLADMAETLIEAAAIYGDDRYREAAKRIGDFLILAQMPDPQPAWAQQYDAAMHPAWARKFEPPAVTGGESQGAMRTLLFLFKATGEYKYLEPIPRALAYLRASRLPDGRLARFYELRTNRPLYFTRSYELTYSDADMPTHYAFKVGHDLDAIEAEHRALEAKPWEAPAPPSAAARPAATPALIARAKAAIARLDAQGRWVEEGRLRYHGDDDPTRRILRSETFIRNVSALSAYLAAVR